MVATIASPTPVFPLVGSIIVAPGFNTPRASASSNHRKSHPVFHTSRRIKGLQFGNNILFQTILTTITGKLHQRVFPTKSVSFFAILAISLLNFCHTRQRYGKKRDVLYYIMRKITKSILTLYPFNYFKFTHYEKEKYPISHDILFYLSSLVCPSKPVFMVYHHDLYADVSFGDYFSVMWHGLPLDLSLAGYLTAIPGLILIASAWTDSSILRRIRQVYFGLIAFVMACIFIVDLGLYGFWGFRLDATPIFYFFSSPKVAIASVSFWFVLMGILAMLVYAAVYVLSFYIVLIRERKPLKIPSRRQKCLIRAIVAHRRTFYPPFVAGSPYRP